MKIRWGYPRAGSIPAARTTVCKHRRQTAQAEEVKAMGVSLLFVIPAQAG